MTVFVLTGIPFGAKKSYVIGVYNQRENAEAAIKIHDEFGYSDLEIEEFELYDTNMDKLGESVV